MGALAGDPTQRVEQLIVLTERLTQFLNAELKAFEARRPQDAAANSAETQRLANVYRHESARIRADPTLIAGAPEPLRQRLMEVTKLFDAVLARHGRALYAAKTITEGLVRAIAEEVAGQRRRVAAYGPEARQYKADASAITLNRRV
jgi:hypothetical protein